jgi:opacity protein-like surface antigen
MDRRRFLLLPMAAVLILATPVFAQDSAATRFYLGLRLGTQFSRDASVADGMSASQFQDVHGLSLGVNLGRYLGVEIAADQWEPNLRRAHAIGEYGLGTVIPQLRVRYPLLDGRLTPYLLGGVGIAFSEFNDRKADAFGRRIVGSDIGVAGAIGGGIEYFVASNVAVGVESRVIIGSPHAFELDGTSRPVTIDAVLTSVSLRVFVPDVDTKLSGDAVSAHGPRGNLEIRAGVARPLNRQVSRTLELRPEGAAIGSLSQLFGVALGVDVSPRWGLWLSAEGFESVLAVRGQGSSAEYALYAVMPQIRLRYPVANGQVVPYVLAGVGASYAEVNDTKPRGRIVKVEGKGFGVAGEAGAGIDYFIARNVAVGLEGKYLYSRDQTVKVSGIRQTLDLDSLLATIGLRLVFP